ncbi:MAG: hypothetical protein ABSG04_12215, partial [Verrucomicrobiota bacterium]
MDSPNASKKKAGSGSAEGVEGSSETQAAAPTLSGAEWSVLFVGGDVWWFDQAKRDLVCLEPQWRSLRAGDGAAAAEVL